jgi:hypothetical protein
LCREPCHRLKSQRESNNRSIHANTYARGYAR